MSNIHKIGKELFITSDEEIKEGDWFIANNGVHKCIRVDKNTSCPFITLNLKGEEIGHFKTWRTKIILTTDDLLIKDGVQAIDEKFLEWFVKNPSCESVEVSYEVLKPFQSNDKGYIIHLPDNEVLGEPKQIKCYCGHTTYCDCGPLEEPKQETLEEYISEVTKNFGDKMSIKFTSGGIKLGAKWQAERMYSEEEVEAIWKFALYSAEQHDKFGTKNKSNFITKDVKEFIEQFKKK